MAVLMGYLQFPGVVQGLMDILCDPRYGVGQGEQLIAQGIDLLPQRTRVDALAQGCELVSLVITDGICVT